MANSEKAIDSKKLQDELIIQSQEAISKIKDSSDLKSLEDLRVLYLGKKGVFSQAMAQLRFLSGEERKDLGQIANQKKAEVLAEIEARKESLEAKQIEQQLLNDSLDASLPGVFYPVAQRHPLMMAMREAIQILTNAGLVENYGPEIEFESYNFDRLNFKENHPARDMQATFFLNENKKASLAEKVVLRTHTSPVQVRSLLEIAKRGFELPIRIQAPGRVYRVDDDATHAPMFHQIEGLAVDRHSTMGDLRAVLDFFFRKFFDDNSIKIRFRPSYFPFTEPSAEVDVSCVFCKGKGCKVCKQSGWLEVAGAGLVHPEVFRACGWDPESVQGWAFGMGIERLAMLKYGIPDLRSFFENRLSFLRGAKA